MCGIAGFVGGKRARSAEELSNLAAEMAGTLRHRGPDDAGVWVDESAGVALGHRRLSIIDLSPEGHQPMFSASGRHVIVFNGEVYNFPSLRGELEGLGRSFRGHSDTEVILGAVEQWGLEASVKRFVGMFAFALWDREDRVLHLVRDRLGIKPLYYGLAGETFTFSSELKALRRHPDFDARVDRDALGLYLRYGYVPAPYTIYEGIRKLPPATILTLAAGRHSGDPARYWSARDIAEAGVARPFAGSMDEAVEELDALLRESVKLRMVADVPLGAFLSGGVDSSTVVALMQAQSERPVKTFTIGFREGAYNEAEDAKAVANHLGTDHTELYVTPDEAMAIVGRLPALYDEPFGDSSQIPTFLISELARRDVTVSLSGDGGDELFAGYNRYFWGRAVWNRFGRLPKAARAAAAKGLGALSPDRWESLFDRLDGVLPEGIKQRQPGDKLHKLAGVLAAEGPEAMYGGLVSHWKEPASLVPGSRERSTLLTDRGSWPRLDDFTAWMMYLDAVTYLPDDILVKVDRASMGVGLEARLPILDHRVFEFAWRIPLSMKISGERGKLLLRQVLYRYVPRELIERPKSGFAVPVDNWLRGPLRDWAETLLDAGRLETEGFLDPAPIRAAWEEHLTGRRNRHFELWDVLMFQAWLEESGL